MVRMDGRERRARLAQRHHLAAGGQAGDPTEAARSLVAVHATDASSVFLGLLARTSRPTTAIAARATAPVEQALYEQRTLVRMLGMRRTLFVVPVELAPIVYAGCTKAIAAQERRKLVQALEAGQVAADGSAWLAALERQTMAALQCRGEALGQELSQDVPALRTTLVYGDESKKWGGPAAITTRVLTVLAAEGRIVRGRPRGSWSSSQHRWAPGPPWLADAGEPAVDEARVALARRWLAAYGPATASDLKWWTGWTVGQTRKALAAIGPVEAQLDDSREPGLLLPDDTAPSPDTGPPWVALLPALDSTAMGWADRTWFLGDKEQQAPHFDRSGNIGPTVWCDGVVVGGWAQRKDGTIALRLLRDVGREQAGAIDAAAAGLRDMIGEVRFTPRFRTPLERELTA